MSDSRTARIANAWGLQSAPNLPAPHRAPAAGADLLPASAAFSSHSSGWQDEPAPARYPSPNARAGAVTLSEASEFILSLIAAHEGRQPGDIVAELIAAGAEAIGLHSLIMRDASDVGDLADVPDYARRAATRFRRGGR